MDELGNGGYDKGELIGKIIFYVLQYEGDDFIAKINNTEPKGHKNLYNKYRNQYIDKIFSDFKAYMGEKFNLTEKSKMDYIEYAKDENVNLKVRLKKDPYKYSDMFFMSFEYNNKNFQYELSINPNREFTEIEDWTLDWTIGCGTVREPTANYRNININELDEDIKFFKREKDFLEDAHNKNSELIKDIKMMPFHIEVGIREGDFLTNKSDIKEVIDYLLEQIDKK